MITLTHEEAQQILDALEEVRYADISASQDKAIETLRARLAQPEPEPVMLMDAPLLLNGQPLYNAPPQREWVGLTDEEIDAVVRDEWVGWPSYDGEFTNIYRLLEAKLKEKNG